MHKRKHRNNFRKTRSKRGGSGKGNSNKRKIEEELPLPPSTSTPLPPNPPITSPSLEKISSNEKEEEEEIATCPICLDDVSKDDPSCKNGHHIHRKCLLDLCQSKRFNKVLCPVCRNNITTKCIQAQEEEGDERRAQGEVFNSKNIFQYIKRIKEIIRSNQDQDFNSIIDQLDSQIGHIWEIILNPMFDINVEDDIEQTDRYFLQKKLLGRLVCHDEIVEIHLQFDYSHHLVSKLNEIFKPIIEYLLQRTDIIVDTQLVSWVMGQTRLGGNKELIPLFKKYKKSQNI